VFPVTTRYVAPANRTVLLFSYHRAYHDAARSNNDRSIRFRNGTGFSANDIAHCSRVLTIDNIEISIDTNNTWDEVSSAAGNDGDVDFYDFSHARDRRESLNASTCLLGEICEKCRVSVSRVRVLPDTRRTKVEVNSGKSKLRLRFTTFDRSRHGPFIHDERPRDTRIELSIEFSMSSRARAALAYLPLTSRWRESHARPSASIRGSLRGDRHVWRIYSRRETTFRKIVTQPYENKSASLIRESENPRIRESHAPV